MKTFYEFIDHQNLENSIIRTANLMVEMDIDPIEFVTEYASEYPELQEGLFGNILKGAAAFGKNVWNGGGVTGGWAQAKDVVAGPGSKFDIAANALKALADALEKNDQTKNMMAADGKTNLAFHIKKILGALEKQKEMIPRMQSAANTQPKYGQKLGTPGTPAAGTPVGTPAAAPSPVPAP